MVPAVSALGALVVSLDSAVNIAFPAMSEAFGVGPTSIKWVVIAYVLAYALMSYAGGSLADRVGHPRVFASGLWLSAASLVACGVAPSYGWFLAFRVAQGVGGGLVYGTAPALVTLALPADDRGRGLGIFTAGMGAGFAVGPVIGGLLVDALGWRWVYLFRAPLALALALGALPALRGVRHGEAGWHLIGLPAILRPPVLLANGLAFLANLAQFAVWLLVPYYLLDLLGLSATAGSLFFMLAPVGMTVAAPLSGWATDRFSSRPLLALGLGAESAGLFMISRLERESALAEVALALALVGLGLGVFQVPNMNLLMARFPATQAGGAGGMILMSRTLGVVAGVSVASAVFGAGSGSFLDAFHAAFRVAAGVASLAFLLSLLPADRHR
ncbi:MAG: MFS transporter [Candidatus Rokubacteria bacterium]|nr:MFS transporter [Candidatus Rokubacteria bacterium]